MILKDRLEDLEFRASNKGYSASYMEAAKRQGVKTDDLAGTMISISPGELQHLFDQIQDANDAAIEAAERADM